MGIATPSPSVTCGYFPLVAFTSFTKKYIDANAIHGSEHLITFPAKSKVDSSHHPNTAFKHAVAMTDANQLTMIFTFLYSPGKSTFE
jgi:hypothetical protein